MKTDNKFIEFVIKRRDFSEGELIDNGTFTEKEIRRFTMQAEGVCELRKKSLLNIPIILVLAVHILLGLIWGIYTLFNSIPVLMFLGIFLWEMIPYIPIRITLHRNSINVKELKSLYNLHN